jgi:hypothetical protein
VRRVPDPEMPKLLPLIYGVEAGQLSSLPARVS